MYIIKAPKETLQQFSIYPRFHNIHVCTNLVLLYNISIYTPVPVSSLPTIEYPAVRPVSQTNPAVADVVVTVIRILDYFVIHQSGVHAARNLPGDADVVFCSQYKILINHLEEDIL